MTTSVKDVDCHAHIIDPVRFPFTGERGYKPRADEGGTREQYCAVLDQHGVGHALLVQVSGYGADNSAIVDAAKTYPGRFKAIAQIDRDVTDHTLADLRASHVVGVRFNLVSYEPDALTHRDAPTLLRRLKALDWFAQIYADDDQWPAAASTLRASGIRVLVDHFGVRDIARGTKDKGFQSVLALGREGNATVKLSSLFRVSKMMSGFDDLDPFVDELLAAYGVERCVWGSDWPFINVAQRPRYADLMAPLARWLPDAADRERVLARNAHRLFGFAS